MGKLTDILRDGDADSLRRQWDETAAADEFGAVLPGGEYVAHIVAGELAASRSKETPSYKLTFKVIEGDQTDRRFWHDIWLTPAALPMAKRDLGKLGVQSLDQLEKPLPKYIRCKVKLAKRRDDDGNEYNRVRSFKILGIDEPEQDPFAPLDNGDREHTDPDEEPADPAKTVDTESDDSY